VHERCHALGDDGEKWFARGMRMLNEGASHTDCPWCEQPLDRSPRIADYRAYFSDEYTQLKSEISAAIAELQAVHGGDVTATFERAVRSAEDRQRFWSDFTNIEPIEADAVQIARDWAAAREAVLQALTTKSGTPLDRAELLPEAIAAIRTYNAHAATVAQLSTRLTGVNPAIREVKRLAATANVQTLESTLNRLKAARDKHTAPTDQFSEDYLQATRDKALTVARRDQAKESLRQYRENVFPQYRATINTYLGRFNAGFTLDQVRARDTAGGPTCTYDILIDNATVAVAGGTVRPGEPSFRNTLSGGDRNTLALAFFFASLDHDQNLAQKSVIVDDPVSSLDDHRSLETIQHLRRLGMRVEQLIVLSHSKPFLCELYGGLTATQCCAVTIVRDNAGSSLIEWDVNADKFTLHDARHRLFLEYRTTGPLNGNDRDAAEAIRPHLEAFLRVAHPDNFRPGDKLGAFRNVCVQRVGTNVQILDQHHIDELRDMIEYGNRFHHDGGNPAWATEAVNDAQLRGFIGRLLSFMQH
jgi:wobble nucleotide-excising tRNase